MGIRAAKKISKAGQKADRTGKKKVAGAAKGPTQPEQDGTISAAIRPLPVVGAGASAGGLDAFAALPSVATQLTPRQREVLQLLGDGRSLKEVAAKLQVSVKTAEFHKYRIMNKLGVRTNAEITKYAVKAGVTSL